MCVCFGIGQLAGCGPQRCRWSGGSGGETAGVATIGSQVLSVTSTPPSPLQSLPSVSILSGGEVAFVMGRVWQLSGTSVSAPLSKPSPLEKSTCPRPRHNFLQHPFSLLFTRLQYMPKVCIWSDCDSRLNGTEVWFCLTDSNASQMDPITCLIVATSCLFFFLRQHSALALRAKWDNLISTAWPPFIFKDS